MLNLLITSIGRDLLSLIGLVAVMAMQDPVMSLFSADRRAAGDADAAQADPPHPRDRASASSPAARASLETLQETLQGMRIVKAFTLEDAMRAPLRRQRRRGRAAKSNKWARVANRSGPLMETLGGFAIALAIDLRRLSA